mmetsp:Transcript_21967/g.61741  ORF Transcript_21967/g.61741 Transcript_21967/m.61741 type:complete len:192 (+) Transcript_21967:58-633(+)|eukprot:CAMPEP_0119127808 /NCGR_PEP_ID=MMETSP1310-20130426/6212_1 /TAXON_ID=464262 /ORGANISM="Genus nov. species nov., Strain RCC2339" /LENGTH=191 /DNA_ID=CAMNT_0007118091 /DNA_START=40 /DNA_END=615 /DNA_ORIENTATION=+
MSHQNGDEEEVERLLALSVVAFMEDISAIQDREKRRELTRCVHARKLEQWKATKGWHGMARHLVEDVHAHFRAGFERARAEKDVRRFQAYNRGLHNHHSIEDRLLFPTMRSARPDLIDAVDNLEQDHRALVELEGRVRAGSMSKGIGEVEGDADNGDAMVAMDEFVFLLLDHLNREEILTVPLLMDGTLPF